MASNQLAVFDCFEVWCSNRHDLSPPNAGQAMTAMTGAEKKTMGFSINGGSPKWMVYDRKTGEKPSKWMIWGCPHLWKPSYQTLQFQNDLSPCLWKTYAFTHFRSQDHKSLVHIEGHLRPMITQDLTFPLHLDPPKISPSLRSRWEAGEM